jgi:ferritin-like metal-binding protein YciE
MARRFGSRYSPALPRTRPRSGTTRQQLPTFNMQEQRKQLIAWLRDAHAMELSLAKVLENHAGDAEEFPDVRERQLQHLNETKRHADMVEQCLAMLDDEPSGAKQAIGKALGKMQGAASGMFGDDVMKNVLSDFSAEQMEIACYRSLVVAARELGEERITEICEEILREEEAMAEWLKERIPDITRTFLHRAPAAR